ncbi:transcription elongation factor GreA [Ignatzschineria cameli]|uniref:Transcription elongation factor GreA n=1 Tax=Ignatzschineria cameli TaxID=2182793 RepID=A0A2U2AL63_9GAMM|nr:transcription elongation factor GreA [Ignatzschineria cameli]PWD83819.1 transcription elongation factor GreA [Ignatzschineria cameli]PWD86099.1 transcription elongation factor GreA [Ignatzschineria cameli]PWD88390.1 transcription elongation factor GreA [Ignatzschineria cameli]PWD88906.1 transcription elongation factor GreA [Ignatzschineria cameli]PWD89623.1 transcription elongation factor GreA [Ignatzschineria cameli]
MNKYPMTKAGAEALRRELDELKQVQRPRVIEAIATAREHGDLKENAEYHAAREEQSFIEGRIADFEARLANAQVIDITEIPNSGKIIFGVTVTLFDLSEDREVTYQIVGEHEADVKKNKLSIASPIARALIGKEVDDLIVIKTPGGDREYEVISVEHI